MGDILYVTPRLNPGFMQSFDAEVSWYGPLLNVLLEESHSPEVACIVFF